MAKIVENKNDLFSESYLSKVSLKLLELEEKNYKSYASKKQNVKLNFNLMPIVYILIALILIQPLTYAPPAYALDLPPDLVEKLHTNLKVAFLYGRGWGTSYERPLPIKYYHIVNIDTAGLYGIKAYDVLVMNRENGELTTEQINMIVEFVRGGGGLIIGYDGYYRELGSSLPILLSKLGIVIKAQSRSYYTDTIDKDGKVMISHPVTTGVESIKFTIDRPVVAVEIDQGTIFINAPFIAVAKDFGNGRVIFIGTGDAIREELSGLRLGVNCVEWVAGYTPPGWEPQTINKNTITVTTTITYTTPITKTITQTSPGSLQEITVTLQEITVTTTKTMPGETVFPTQYSLVAIIIGIVIGLAIGYAIRRR